MTVERLTQGIKVALLPRDWMRAKTKTQSPNPFHIEEAVRTQRIQIIIRTKASGEQFVLQRLNNDSNLINEHSK
jgi:hypothetical protein